MHCLPDQCGFTKSPWQDVCLENASAVVSDQAITQVANTLSLVALRGQSAAGVCLEFAGCGHLAGCSASSPLGEPTPQDQSCQFLCHWHWSKWQRCSICCCKQWTRPCRRRWHTPPVGCRLCTSPLSALAQPHDACICVLHHLPI